jgi:hypothetical protein
MPTVSQAGFYNLQVLTSTGAPAASYRLYTFEAGSTTHKIAYTDSAGATAHTYTSDGIGGQYIALNARGELPAPLWLQTGAYDIKLADASGASVWTRRAVPMGDTTIDLGGGTWAWADSNPAIDFDGDGSISGGADQVELAWNTYFDGSDYVAKKTGIGLRVTLSAAGMFFYRAPSVTAGDAQTFTQIAKVTQYGLTLGTQSCVHAISTGDQGTTSATPAELVTLTTEVVDVGGDYNTTTCRFTAPEDGVYEVVYSGIVVGAAGAVRGRAEIRKNGASAVSGSYKDAYSSGTGDTVGLVCPAYLSLVAGDYVSVFISRVTGSVDCVFQTGSLNVRRVQ